MTPTSPDPVSQPIAILAGSGVLPAEAAQAVLETGREVLVIGLGDEADLSVIDPRARTHRVEWGQVGGLFKTLKQERAEKLVIVGGIGKRPDLGALKLDWGAVQLLPRLANILFGGGDTVVLDRVASLFADQGVTLAGVHEVAPALVAEAGLLAGPKPNAALAADAQQAAKGAWTAGALDVGQAAVAVGKRLVALEGAEGTDGLLQRVGDMGKAQRFSAKPKSGALAKCPRPQQDLRLDMPAIGPTTVTQLAQSGLSCLVVEAGSVLISQKGKTLALCREHGVSLLAHPRSFFAPPNSADAPL
ncbi:MAG: UDP-2,3-diacylglucosamine diphosphatase LpxI [Devosiaceae bacterium]|nr:UDP-2,3-diacylglucosamine diphosphatase LpxI [Devosiaceae bacterium MH13]